MKSENQTSLPNKPLAWGVAVASALMRLVPHLENFSPVGGSSLFAGARIAGWKAYVLPPAVLFLTAPILGYLFNYAPYSWINLVVYASLLINVRIGRLLAGSRRPWAIGGAALLCSTQFFLITNFGFWLSGVGYPYSLAGLAACFLAAIPYFGRTVASDLLYAGLCFGAYEALIRLNRLNRGQVPAGS